MRWGLAEAGKLLSQATQTNKIIVSTLSKNKLRQFLFKSISNICNRKNTTADPARIGFRHMRSKEKL